MTITRVEKLGSGTERTDDRIYLAPHLTMEKAGDGHCYVTTTKLPIWGWNVPKMIKSTVAALLEDPSMLSSSHMLSEASRWESEAILLLRGI